MKYLVFIWADGLPAPEELAVMQRECPGWIEEMDGRGVRLLGRELELPETAATVRVRDGEMRGDAAQRRAVHRDQGVHRRHRRRQLC